MNSAIPPPHSDIADIDADVIVIGAGIYGLMVALEAGKTGRRVVVLERGAVGGGTSSNWFRILHGGLRYLQRLDIPRVLESVAERRWFQRFAPDLVRPQGFLMPLYGDGIRRPSAFRGAFLADAALGMRRNAGLSSDQRLPRGRVLDAEATLALFPSVARKGLQGGALWYDAVADDGERLIERICATTRTQGARIHEHVEVLDLVVKHGAVVGVVASHAGMASQIVHAPVVINAAGPACVRLAERFDRPTPALFRPALGFNLMLDVTPPASVGLAVSPPGAPSQALFVYPHEGRTFAGTGYAARRHETRDAVVSPAEIDAFLLALNKAIPTLGAKRDDVVQVYAGLLPAESDGSVVLSDREIIRNHGAHGGPSGLFSVSGVKFTTARRVAEKLVRSLPPIGAAAATGRTSGS